MVVSPPERAEGDKEQNTEQKGIKGKVEVLSGVGI